MTLSVVIVIASDTLMARGGVDHLRHCLGKLHRQEDPPLLEVVVPHRAGVCGLDELRREFPDVRFARVDDLKRSDPRRPGREHHDELRAKGIALTRGDVVALLEDHEYPAARWAAEVAAAHLSSDVEVIGGAVENSVDRPLNWALFFCDFAQYLNPVSRGPSLAATDVNVSYKRHALDAVVPVWRERFHERLIHDALVARGFRLALAPAIVVHQHRVDVAPRGALWERFLWGRSYAASRAEHWGHARRLVYTALCPLLPLVLMSRIAAAVLGKRRCRREFLRALPWLVPLSAAWSVGELVGYLTVRPHPGLAAACPAEGA
ncbi:MAG: hypothetical protein ACRD15_07410 [Vicinamibacterales bacterium]